MLNEDGTLIDLLFFLMVGGVLNVAPAASHMCETKMEPKLICSLFFGRRAVGNEAPAGATFQPVYMHEVRSGHVR